MAFSGGLLGSRQRAQVAVFIQSKMHRNESPEVGNRRLMTNTSAVAAAFLVFKEVLSKGTA